MALTDKLTAIGDAIREKTGGSELMTLDAMPDAIRGISGGGGSIEVEPVVLTGNQNYGCTGPVASKYIELFGDTISTKNIKDADYMFYNSTLERIPFALNYDNTTYRKMNYTFCNCINLTEVPEMSNVYPSDVGNFFENCYNLRELPEGFGSDWNWNQLHTYGYSRFNNMFSSCHSLRKVPADILKNMWGLQTSTAYNPTNNTFNKCYVLDEIRDFPIHPATLTGNCFDGIIQACSRLKSFTFATNEDGTPKTANWKNQTIDIINKFMMYPIGYAYLPEHITGYNSGITADKEVVDDASYQALKDDPDWFTCKMKYSRYNHDSAVETINSLPDCSAYLATAGGTNTIKFQGEAGSATDGGAINTLTEEEIAVATAKGWTVQLV